jgi:hypothetical protein
MPVVLASIPAQVLDTTDSAATVALAAYQTEIKAGTVVWSLPGSPPAGVTIGSDTGVLQVAQGTTLTAVVVTVQAQGEIGSAAQRNVTLTAACVPMLAWDASATNSLRQTNGTVANTSGQYVNTWWPTSGDTTRALVVNQYADVKLKLNITTTDGKWGLLTRNTPDPATETFQCMSLTTFMFSDKTNVSGTTYFMSYYTKWPSGIPGYGRPIFFNGGQVQCWLGRNDQDTVNSIQIDATVYRMNNSPVTNSTRMVLGFRFNTNNSFSYCTSANNPSRTITTFATSANFTQVGNKLDLLGQMYGGSFPCVQPIVS